MNLFEHVMGESPFLGERNVPIDRRGQAANRFPGGVSDRHRPFFQNNGFAILKVEGPAGVRNKSEEIACQKMFFPPDSQNQGASFSRPNDLFRMTPVENNDGIGPHRFLKRLAYGLPKVSAIGGFDQVRQDFRIGLRGKGVSGLQEAFAKNGIILDDAVMDDGDVAAAVEVGMGVGLVGDSVRSPSGMAYPDTTRDAVLAQRIFKDRELPLSLPNDEVSARKDRNARGIVPAVLQSLQTLENKGECLVLPDVPHDPAHN